MVWAGAVVVLVTFAALLKRYETRMVLLVSGALMAALSGNLTAALDAFGKAMVNDGLVPVICTVMGFAFVMKHTQCDVHLFHWLTGFLKSGRTLLIPGTVLVTFAINAALPSAAGCAAAVGAILIPLLTNAGIHPAIAGSAVLAGTWGSSLNPGNIHNPLIAKMAGVSVGSVIAGHTVAALAGVTAAALALAAVAACLREHKDYEGPVAAADDAEEFKVEAAKAVIPVVPLALLVVGGFSRQFPFVPAVSVPQAMLLGAVLGLLASRGRPDDISQQFFSGMGDAYARVIGMIIAAAVFNEGMRLIGLTEALVGAMKQSQAAAGLAATLGPFAVAVLSGSGDAATLAFNGTVTPYAAQAGFSIPQLGSQAFLAGALGRSMSPVAGAAMVCAALAGVHPIEIAKRNAPGMALAAILTMLILL